MCFYYIIIEKDINVFKKIEVSLLLTMSSTLEVSQSIQEELNKKKEENGKTWLKKLLNQNFRVEMTDGRVLIGVFLCTDRDANVILGACSEYLKNKEGETDEPRVLGLVMVPGRHIVSIQLDDTAPAPKYYNE